MALGLANLAARIHQPSVEEMDRAEAARSAFTGVGSDERGRPMPFDDGKFTAFEAAGEGMKFTQAAAGVAREHVGEGLGNLKEGYDKFTNDFSEGFGDTVGKGVKGMFHPLSALRERFGDIQQMPEMIWDNMENVSEAVRNSPGYVRDMASQAGSRFDQMGKESIDAYLNSNYRDEGNLSDISGKLASAASGAEVETQGPSVADRVGEIQSQQADQAQAALGDEGMER